jgi:hypothetical protein
MTDISDPAFAREFTRGLVKSFEEAIKLLKDRIAAL